MWLCIHNIREKIRDIEAKNYFELALSIMKTTGNRQGEAVYYRRLGKLLLSSGKHNKGKECLEKAIQIDMQLGNKICLEVDYEELLLFYKLGKYERAREYLERALTIWFIYILLSDNLWVWDPTPLPSLNRSFSHIWNLSCHGRVKIGRHMILFVKLIV